MKYTIPKIFIVLLILIIAGCDSLNNSSKEDWVLVYRHDSEEKAIFGDKERLIDAVRKGLPIRVGFGGRSSADSTRSVEHITEAKFLTILDGKEVFAQIDPIIGQQPIRFKDGIILRFRDANQWVKIAGTNGYSTGLMTDYLNDSIVSPSKDNWRGASWFVYQVSETQEQVAPLYDK
ncbi:hypothetical protein [Roseivirga sp.]|uniref:hypothetical protein n=1 Tax=Roseivirga sp. TaxID=1964215 RepID=UPI003B8DABEC